MNLIGGANMAADCVRPLRGPNAAFIPNVVVQSHDNRKAFFYGDLVHGKTVLIHCVSTQDADSSESLEIMAKVQSQIGPQLGRKVFIYSLALDPARDTPQALRSLAGKYGAGEGWLFLTGEPAALQFLRENLFSHSGGHDCSTSLIRYGNEACGVWGAVLASGGAQSIMERLSWIEPRERPAGPPRRRGPTPLADHNSAGTMIPRG
jgi:protein SCO1/2